MFVINFNLFYYKLATLEITISDIKSLKNVLTL